MKIKFIYKIDMRNKTAYNVIAEKQSQAEGGGKQGRKSELRKDAAVYGEKCAGNGNCKGNAQGRAVCTSGPATGNFQVRLRSQAGRFQRV